MIRDGRSRPLSFGPVLLSSIATGLVEVHPVFNMLVGLTSVWLPRVACLLLGGFDLSPLTPPATG